jgi:CRISPR-associated protein Csy1
LLASVPPNLQNRDIRFPVKSFFDESLWFKYFSELFHNLHEVMNIQIGGDIPRQKILVARDNAIQAILLEVMEIVYKLRFVSVEQFRESSSLPNSQVIWLCANKVNERESSDAWLEDIIHECVRWLINSYRKALGDQSILLGSTEFIEIKEMIEQWVIDNKEFLR